MWLLDALSVVLVVAVGVATNQILNNGVLAWRWLIADLAMAGAVAVVTHKASAVRVASARSAHGSMPDPTLRTGSGGTTNVFSGQSAGSVIQARNVRIQQPAVPVLPSVAAVAADGLVGLPRRPSPVFVGRQEALRRVGRALRAGQTGVITQAVVGLGGVGKSELALQYADRRRGDYELVWWLVAETPGDIQAGLAELCRELCTPVSSAAAARAPAAEATAWAVAWLAAHERWLMIFDNAEDLDHLQPYLGRLRSGHVLVTSRRAIGWDQIGTVLRLPVLERTDAVALLTRTAQPVAPDQTLTEAEPSRVGAARADISPRVLAGAPAGGAAHELAEELGGLPLALRQAGAYIAATPGMTVAGYLHRLRTSPQWAMAARPAHRPDQGSGRKPGRTDEQVVAGTWALTIDRIQRIRPLAVRMLRLLACYAPDRLPSHVLYGLPDTGQVQVGEALTALVSYSMIDISPDRQYVSVHRLVQAATRVKLSETDQTADRDIAAALLQAALPDDPKSIASWPDYAELLPHARLVLAPDSPAMVAVIEYANASGDYRTARDLERIRAATLQHTLGPEHLETLIARSNLANWTGRAGDVAGARNMFAELLPLYEGVLGLDHPDTLTDRSNLAYWTGEAGDAASARDMLTELLPLRQRVSGAEHPETLNTHANLANWTGKAGDAAGARNMFAELLPLRQRVSGPEHPDTLTTRTNLTYWTGEAGDFTGARNMFAELLPVRERVLGPEHPDTLIARASLARWTGEAGDAAGARNMFAELLPVRQRVLGPEHPDTLTDRASLARWTGEAGDAAGARNMFAELLPVRQRVLGPEHPDTLTDRANLTYWAEHAGAGS
ncbi:tetratricopeptide repeat protein [Actinoallomurus sp. NBC_01490]|uniref:tetratricopeptide repeat protein n=1 Tax=Actinoallomurus sp. NBC_01490 TaxID=2903557 RepID=UPI002E3080FC|nr:tetratricopeptide repeat protein [Actinoallomurus sp. NBC_01490]